VYAPHRLAFAAKRALDIGASAAGLLMLAPLGLCAAAAIAREDGRPMIYRATRVGRYGRPFTMYKLRTMRRDAASRGPAITTAADPRVTRVGRLLRRTRIDELPQLWNVLRGEMSLVGPRPEDPAYVALYTPAQRVVLTVRPGITGLAQLAFADETRRLRPGHAHEDYVNVVLPAKLVIDLEYVATLSPWRDLRILARTARAPTLRHGPAKPSKDVTADGAHAGGAVSAARRRPAPARAARGYGWIRVRRYHSLSTRASAGCTPLA